jgi:FAD:protein FMN transferase
MKEPAAAFTAPEDGPQGDVLRFSHAAMATVFEVHCVHAGAGYARQAAHAAFELVDRLEQELSRFIPNSDISRINALGAGESSQVSPSTMECLQLARDLYAVTDRAFDIAIGTGLDGLELDHDAFVVHARAGGIRLDLGGIGKGYAVDRMAELLEEWEIPRALVHGGFSSVRAMEPPPERDGWALTLSAPGASDPSVLARISARQQALSASGTRKGDHIRDPRDHGRAVRDRAAWVALPSGAAADRETAEPPEWRSARRWPAAVADALSTAFMILPAPHIAELCGRCPGAQAWLLLEPAEPGAAAPALVHLGG